MPDVWVGRGFHQPAAVYDIERTEVLDSTARGSGHPSLLSLTAVNAALDGVPARGRDRVSPGGVRRP